MSTKVIGAVLGAIIAPIVLVLLVWMIYPSTGGENWDWVTPLFTLLAAGAAIIGGAIVGALVAEALQDGDSRRALVFVGIGLAGVAVFPLWLLSLWYGPAPKVKPVKASERGKWVAEKRRFHGPAGFIEENGRQLAWVVRGYYRSGGGMTDWRRLETEDDSVAGRPEAYQLSDDGWRWRIVDGPPRYGHVFLDPILGKDAPTFEVDQFDIFRRETADSPAFATDTLLAGMLGFPECISRFMQAARANGTWSGRIDSLPAIIGERWVAPDGCPNVKTGKAPENGSRTWQVNVQGNAMTEWRFEMFAAREDTMSVTPYFFGFMYDGRGFSRDPGGNWRMRPSSIQYTHDLPAPPRCLFHLTVACGSETGP